MTLSAFRKTATASLQAIGRADADLLVKHWLADRKLRSGQTELNAKQLKVLQDDLSRLVQGEPLAYVTGVAHFYGLELSVGAGVLIPRAETEELVRWIGERESSQEPLRFVDFCTGSGCIALALCVQNPNWVGLGVDVDETALGYARRNVALLGLSEQLDLLQGDVLSPVNDKSAVQPVDFIVSNPPYIPSSDWHRVAEDVAGFEPRLALEVKDDDPLLFYPAVLAQAEVLLKPSGRVYLECNDLYAEQVARLLSVAKYKDVEILIDMQGKPRHVCGTAPKSV